MLKLQSLVAYASIVGMAPHVNFRRETSLPEGLRSRKKARTRLVIEDVALGLFAEQGYDATTVEQIAERAEISATTFFRYYPSKADLVMCQQNAQLPVLQQAIVERPAHEQDLVAVRRAIQLVWAPAIDAERTLRTTRAFAESATLRGLQDDVARDWARAIAEALAVRHGLDGVDEACRVIARMALGVFGATIEGWIAGRCREPIGDAIGRNFDTALRVVGGGPRDPSKA
jgi:AcrR family transcriptional regulator